MDKLTFLIRSACRLFCRFLAYWVVFARTSFRIFTLGFFVQFGRRFYNGFLRRGVHLFHQLKLQSQWNRKSQTTWLEDWVLLTKMNRSLPKNYESERWIEKDKFCMKAWSNLRSGVFFFFFSQGRTRRERYKGLIGRGHDLRLAWSNVTHLIFRLSMMLAKVEESCGSFMVGYKKQKSFLVAAVVFAVFLIALYFNSRRKPFKPFTALILSTTHAQLNSGGLDSFDKDKLKYQVYNNSVQFDHVSKLSVVK